MSALDEAGNGARRPVTVISLLPESALALLSSGAGVSIDGWLERVDAVVLARPRPSEPSGALRGADTTLLAAALIPRRPSVRWIVGADLAREYPYNLARRVASIAALSSVGVGVLLESTPSVIPGAEAATAAEVVADGVVVLQKLWQSWPTDSVIADKAARRFVDSSQLRRIDHEGVFRVAGPLQLPVDPSRQPLVLQRDDLDDPAADASAEVLVTRLRPSSSPSSSSGDGRPRLFEVDAAELTEVDGGLDVLLTGDPEDIVDVLRRRAERGQLPPAPRDLRRRLGARPPVARLLSAAVAFPTEIW